MSELERPHIEGQPVKRESTQEFSASDCDKALDALEKAEKELGGTDRWEQALNSRALNTLGRIAFKPFELPALAIIGLAQGGDFAGAKRFIVEFRKEMFPLERDGKK